MNRKLPTSGQIERDLSQRIQKLYREQLGHCPRKVTCKLFDNRLAVVIEDSLTILQKTLVEEDDGETARYVNLAIDNVIKSKLKIAIEEVLDIEVYDILFDSSLKSQSAGAIVILTQSPSVRSRELTPKIRKSQFQDKSIEDKSSLIDNNNSVSATELKTENV